eukprot:7249102-Alexandrium_andersonii.AAC.1
MSASLVGSEMCIRDRHRSSRRFRICQRLRGVNRSEGAKSRGNDLQSAIPVSYTHLTLPTICSV